jgi:hypothetical protein
LNDGSWPSWLHISVLRFVFDDYEYNDEEQFTTEYCDLGGIYATNLKDIHDWIDDYGTIQDISVNAE